jgi:penicillin-binding protein 2
MRQPWRLTVIGVIFLGLFGILTLRLWYLQVSAIDESLDTAEAQQLSTVTIEAPRGDIYDRNGTLMAGTEAARSGGPRGGLDPEPRGAARHARL